MRVGAEEGFVQRNTEASRTQSSERQVAWRGPHAAAKASGPVSGERSSALRKPEDVARVSVASSGYRKASAIMQDDAASLPRQQLIPEQLLDHPPRQRLIARDEPVAAKIEAPTVLRVCRAESPDERLTFEHDRLVAASSKMPRGGEPARATSKHDERGRAAHESSTLPPVTD